MAGGKPILALLALILVAGGILLDIFVVLSGTKVNTTPINKIYFLEASTQGMGNAPATTAWTYFSVCSFINGGPGDCRPVSAAPPFDPPRNFGASPKIPAGFDGTNFYYYMSRVAWAFYLIALFFGAITLAMGIFACCARIAGFLSGFFASVAALMQAVAAALMTAWTVKARNVFQSSGHAASLGRYAYGFTWASFACFFLAMILFCSSGGSRKNKHQEEERQDIDPATGQPIVMEQQQGTSGGFFGRNSSSKNREVGVKDEYS